MAYNVSSPIRSPIDSPASSVRQSLDIPGNSSIRSQARRASPSPNPSSQRRNKAALRDYYHLQSTTNNDQARIGLSRTASVASTTSTVTNTNTTTTPSASTAASQADASLPLLDSPDFSPESYVTSLMSTSSLYSILRAESALVSEIKNLDGERKALVYDNYSKLIRATETIAQLQKGMDDSSGSGGGLKFIGTLIPAVEKVAETAKDIQSSRQESHGRRRALERGTVHWVLDAPQRFASLAENGRADQVLDEWEDVRALLDSWKHVKGTEEVRKSCEAALQRMEEQE